MKPYTKKRIICFSLCTAISGALLATSVAAVQPSYKMSECFAESKFYERLLSVEPTGDQRYDVIAVAISQLGYHEGNSDADMGGMNASGNRNFVEYNHIIGGPLDNGEGNGTSYGFEWCAAFVSWCLRQADVPTSKIKTEVSCTRLSSWLSERSFYKTRSSGYTPITGDLIFFKYSSSSYNPTHVGLVVGSDSTYVYTIEGNNGGRVNYHKYKKSDSTITGYGVPDYTTLSEVKYDFALKEGYIEPGVYVTTADLNIRTGQSTSTASLGKIPTGTTIEITEAIGDWARVSYNGKSGWSSIDYLTYHDAIKYTVTYDANGGSFAPGGQQKTYGEELMLSSIKPERGAYVFLGWATSKNAESAEYLPEDTYSKNASLTLYAIWDFVGYSVTFLDEDGSVLSQRSYAPEAEIVLPDEPSKSSDLLFDYEFAGWNPTIPEKVTEDLTFTATYEKLPIPDKTDKGTEKHPETEPESEVTNGNEEATSKESTVFNTASLLAGITSFIAVGVTSLLINKRFW